MEDPTLYIKSELFDGVNMLEGLTDWDAGMNGDGEFYVAMKFSNQETAQWWAQVLLGDK